MYIMYICIYVYMYICIYIYIYIYFFSFFTGSSCPALPGVRASAAAGGGRARADSAGE